MKRAWTSAWVVAVPATVAPFLAGLALGAAEREPGPGLVLRVAGSARTAAPAIAALAPPALVVEGAPPAPVTPPQPQPAPVALVALLADDLAALPEEDADTFSLDEAIGELEDCGLERAARALLDAALARWPAEETLQERLRERDPDAFYAVCERAYRLDPTEERRGRLLDVLCEDELHDREAALCREGLATQEPWALDRLAHADPVALLDHFNQYAGVLGQRPESLAAAADACDSLGFDERSSNLRQRANELSPDSTNVGWATQEEEVAHYRVQLLSDDEERAWELRQLEQLAPAVALEVARTRARRAPGDGVLASQEVALLHRLGHAPEAASRLGALESAPGETQLRAAFELFNNHGDELKPAGARLLARAYARGAAGTHELGLVAQLDPALALSVVRPQLPPEVLQAVLSHVATHPGTGARVAAEVERVVEAPPELIQALIATAPDVAERLLLRARLLRPEDAAARDALAALRVAGR